MKYTIPILFFYFLSNSLNAQTVSEPIIDYETFKVEIFFETGSAELTTEAEMTLKELSKYQEQKGLNLRITAHTDSIGSVAANRQLSEERATTVKGNIVSLGLDIDSLFMNHFGEEQPRSDNEDEQGRQDNRRCTVVLSYPKRLVWVDGIVQDSLSQPLAAKVIIKTKESKDETETDSLGKYRLKVPFNKVASLEIYPEDHFYDTKMFKTTPGKKDIKMKFEPLRIGGKIRLNNFYFVGNQAVLLKRSKPELVRLLQFMENMSELTINIVGHINQPGMTRVDQNSVSFQLSENRAKLIYSYLLDKGIAETRMQYEGKGNWEMKFPLAKSEYQMELNRRVEITILNK